jgi:four helix bundle protein
MQRFTELQIWRRSHQLAVDVYRLTTTFPRAERFGLVAQVRRAAVLIVANIAEGAKRQSNRDDARFLNIAEGSLAETEALLLLSRDLEMVATPAVTTLIAESEEISRMVYAMRRSVEGRHPPAR